MIEVFKTNVEYHKQAEELADLLLDHFPDSKVNFDLEDCDKILRVEGKNFIPDAVIRVIRNNGFDCAVLEY